MSKAKLTYEYNNKSGKRVIHIDYQSDSDSMAHEHEREHARIVRELVGKGVISDDDEVVIDRKQVEQKEEGQYVPEVPKAQEN